MTVPLAVLHVEDNVDDHLLVLRTLQQGGYDVKAARFETSEEMRAALAAQPWDIILCDHKLPHFDSFGALQVLKESGLDLPFIIVSGSIVGEIAVEVMRLGAQDFIFKDNLTRLVPAIQRELREAEGRRARKQAEESIQRQAAMLESVNDAMVASDAQYCITAWNPAAEHLFGWEAEEVLGSSELEITRTEWPNKDADEMRRMIAKDGRWRGEATQQRKDGTRFPVEVSSRVLTDETGQITGYVSVSRDITERLRMQAKLLEERILLRTLIDTVPDRLYAKDVEGRKTMSNIADWKASGGKTLEDVIGKTDFDVYPPEMAAEYWSIDKAVLDLGLPIIDHEESGLDSQGALASVLSSKVPLRDAHGKVVGLVGVGHDITLYKRAEEALRESEARFKTIFEEAPLGIAVIDSLTGHISELNPRFAEIAGRSMEEMANIDWMTITHPDDLPADLAKMALLNAKKIDGYHMEKRCLHPDGTAVWIHMTIARLNVEDQANPYHLSMIEDISQRKLEEQKALGRLRRLAALRSIDTAISSTFDLRVTLSFLLQQVTLHLGVDAAVVLLLDRSIQELRFSAEHGFRGKDITRLRLRLGQDYAGRAALERRSIYLPSISLAEPPFTSKRLTENEGFVAYWAVPLIAKGQVKGVLEIFHRSALDPDPEWTDFLETLAGQTAIAIDNAELFGDLQQLNAEMQMAYDRTIEGWSRAMDLRDKETEGHTLRVTATILELGRKMQIKESQLAHMRRGALLHDIGKLGVPDSILHKAGELTDEEWVIMRRHPTHAYEMLSPIAYLEPALDIPYCHHEKWDGTGYPRGLKGAQIPLAARVFAVVDVWDALTSDRGYRPAWPREKAREHIRASSGTHFDPQVVDAFLQILDGT